MPNHAIGSPQNLNAEQTLAKSGQVEDKVRYFRNTKIHNIL